MHPKDTAGSRMKANVPTTHSGATIGDVSAMLRQLAAHAESLHYIYVLDDSRKLTGVLPIREVFRHEPHVRVADVCRRNDLHFVHPETHQERAAYIALKYGIKAVPVVDRDHTFLGAITGDVLLHILYKETHEDLLRRSGLHGHPMFDNVLTLPLHVSILHRLPWLLLGLLGGMFAAQVVSAFEQTLEQNLLLAAFIPLIVYISSAVATQTEAFIIRDLAMDHRIPFHKYVLRQSAVVGSLAALCAASLFGMSAWFHGQIAVSTVLAVALFVAVASSLLTGLLIPLLFSRFRADPANASGPIATIIQDILSLVIYFATASVILG